MKKYKKNDGFDALIADCERESNIWFGVFVFGIIGVVIGVISAFI